MGAQVDSRFMRRSRKSRAIAAVFGALAALALSGCGSDEDEIPNRSADELLGLIGDIRTAVNEDRCDDAQADASTLTIAVNDLVNQDVPDDVVTGLQQGATSLQSLIAERCGTETETTTTATAETTTTTEPVTTTEETTTTTDETTTTETTTPDDGDGEGSGGGNNGDPGAGGTEAPGGGSGASPRAPGPGDLPQGER